MFKPRRGGRSSVAPTGLNNFICIFSQGLRPGLHSVAPDGLSFDLAIAYTELTLTHTYIELTLTHDADLVSSLCPELV